MDVQIHYDGTRELDISRLEILSICFRASALRNGLRSGLVIIPV